MGSSAPGRASGREAAPVDDGRSDELVLVDLLDCEVGSATKLEAHTKGLLHRAFSVVLWREAPQGPVILMQLCLVTDFQ